MGRFVALDRDTAYLLPPSVNEWLPADQLARFVVEVIEPLDVALDGTKIEANESKHKTLKWPSARPSARQARSRGARTPSLRKPAPRTAIRST
jgi:hypothetical protein